MNGTIDNASVSPSVVLVPPVVLEVAHAGPLPIGGPYEVKQ